MRAKIWRALCGTALVMLLATPNLVQARSSDGNGAGPSAAAAATVGPNDWLGEINRYREASGLPPVADQPAWDLGLRHHLTYLQKTPKKYYTGKYQSLHTENPASPYYTQDGAQEAASSDLAEGVTGSPVAAIDGWLTAPFHAIGMLRPNLTQVAFGLSDGYAGLDVISGLDYNQPPATKPVLFPGPNMTTNLTRFGGEYPDPLETCHWQGQSVGLPLIVLLPQAPSSSLSATLAGPKGTSSTAAHSLCVVDENTYYSSDTVYGPTGKEILQGDHAVLLIPHAPLSNGRYSVAVQQPGQSTIDWSFSVNTSGGGGLCALCVNSAHPVALQAPKTLRAGHAIVLQGNLRQAGSVTWTVTGSHGRRWLTKRQRLRKGRGRWVLRVAREASRRGSRLTVAGRFRIGKRIITLRRTIRFT